MSELVSGQRRPDPDHPGSYHYTGHIPYDADQLQSGRKLNFQVTYAGQPPAHVLPQPIVAEFRVTYQDGRTATLGKNFETVMVAYLPTAYTGGICSPAITITKVRYEFCPIFEVTPEAGLIKETGISVRFVGDTSRIWAVKDNYDTFSLFLR